MRSALPPLSAVLAASALVLGGCALPEAGGTDQPASKDQAKLSFSYAADGGDGFIDQTLKITNTGAAASAPELVIVPLDADGAELPEVTVVTAFGSDKGKQVVPAYTEVTDILKFKGPGSKDVADVEVSVAALGTVDGAVPPANDIRVKRFDISGKSKTQNTLGSVKIFNTYDKPITVEVVGVEFAEAGRGETTHFKRVSPLVGPLELQPGESVRERVPAKYRLRFFGTVRAYLVP